MDGDGGGKMGRSLGRAQGVCGCVWVCVRCPRVRGYAVAWGGARRHWKGGGASTYSDGPHLTGMDGWAARRGGDGAMEPLEQVDARWGVVW